MTFDIETLKKIPRLFGLIGYPLSHSFSKKYFGQKFKTKGIKDAFYESFPLEKIELFPTLLKDLPNLVGINVTIPYKQQVIPFLDGLDPGAEAVGAVNTIHHANGKLTGYNTDVYGFEESLLGMFKEANVQNPAELKALILGTGGAAKAVAYVLGKLNIEFSYVSRNSITNGVTYDALNQDLVESHRLIVNTTPLGMAPKIESFPNIPYNYIGNKHLLYDLVYNPAKTTFMQKGEHRKATTINGLQMLHLQAEKAWAIWNRI